MQGERSGGKEGKQAGPNTTPGRTVVILLTLCMRKCSLLTLAHTLTLSSVCLMFSATSVFSQSSLL